MKLSILLLSVIFSLNIFGQKAELINVNKKKKYPYEYWFQFEHIEDTSSHQISFTRTNTTSLIKINNNKGEDLFFANIEVINLENKTDSNLTLNLDGESQINLKNGKYRIKVNAFDYEGYKVDIEIKNAKQIELIIKLGLRPELTVYQIDSKKEMNEIELAEIIECIRINRPEYYNTCSKNKKYLISTHI